MKEDIRKVNGAWEITYRGQTHPISHYTKLGLSADSLRGRCQRYDIARKTGNQMHSVGEILQPSKLGMIRFLSLEVSGSRIRAYEGKKERIVKHVSDLFSPRMLNEEI